MPVTRGMSGDTGMPGRLQHHHQQPHGLCHSLLDNVTGETTLGPSPALASHQQGMMGQNMSNTCWQL